MVEPAVSISFGLEGGRNTLEDLSLVLGNGQAEEDEANIDRSQ